MVFQNLAARKKKKKVQNQIVSQVNSTKHLEKGQHVSYSNSSQKLHREKHSQVYSMMPPSP